MFHNPLVAAGPWSLNLLEPSGPVQACNGIALPLKSHLTLAAFSCHDQGASSLVYAPQHQLVISAGKKGDVCIIDVRQRQLRQRFQAHESPIKCLAIDPGEEFFVTGSADGDIKVRTEFIGTV
jgi:WD40 repeat protein